MRQALFPQYVNRLLVQLVRDSLMRGESERETAKRMGRKFKSGMFNRQYRALNVLYGLSANPINRIRLAVAIFTAGDCPCAQCRERSSAVRRAPASVRRRIVGTDGNRRSDQCVLGEIPAHGSAHV